MFLFPSFSTIADVAFTHFDDEDLEFSPKELKEKMNDQKRYLQYYKEILKDVLNPLRNYMETKKKGDCKWS